MTSLLTLLQTSYATGWLVAAPIGPVNLEIIRRGLRQGLTSGLLVGLGAVCVDGTYLTVFSLGLGAALRGPAVQTAAYGIGGLVLCWIAIGALNDARHHWGRRNEKTEPDGTTRGGARAGDAPDGVDGRGGNGGGDDGGNANGDGAPNERKGPAPPTPIPSILNKPSTRRFNHTPLGCYLVGIGMTATNPMTIAFWSTLALNFLNLPVGYRLAATVGVMLGALSWVTLLTVLLAFARRWVGPRLFAFVTLAGGSVVLYFGLLYVWRGLSVERWIGSWLS